MGDFLKKYPADQVKTDFEEKKILARKYLAKKIPTLKKMASSPYKGLGQNILKQTKSPIPPPPPPGLKSQIVGPSNKTFATLTSVDIGFRLCKSRYTHRIFYFQATLFFQGHVIFSKSPSQQTSA